jgi:hypothetical protein
VFYWWKPRGVDVMGSYLWMKTVNLGEILENMGYNGFLDEKYRVPSNAISRFRLILRNASRYPFFLNISNNANESWKKSLRMDIVENISNMIIAGDISDFKKSFCITLPLRFLHCSLIRQKR